LRLKRELLVSAIVTLLLFSVLLFVPVKATTAEPPTWKMPRPTALMNFNDNISSAAVSGDNQCAVSLGVNVGQYVPAGSNLPDRLDFSVDVAATTREGIYYTWQYSPCVWVGVNQQKNVTFGDNSCVFFNLTRTIGPVLFYGVYFSGLWLYRNGFISFTNVTSGNLGSASPPSSWPNPNVNATIVAPFWRVLNLSRGGSITTTYLANDTWQGDYNHAYLVFTWNDIPDLKGQPQTFQILIQQQGVDTLLQNCFIFQYQNVNVTDGVSTIIGIQDRLGHHGQSQQPSSISTQNGEDAGSFSVSSGPQSYGDGYHLTGLTYTIAKVVNMSGVYLPQADLETEIREANYREGGYNVQPINSSAIPQGTNWVPAITAGAGGLLLALQIGGVVTGGNAYYVEGLFVLVDITATAASYLYKHAAGQIIDAGNTDIQASGTLQTVPDSFDASYTDIYNWYMHDSESQNHTIMITATAYYQNDYGVNKSSVSTLVVLNMYTGYHYLDIGSEWASPSNPVISGFPISVDGVEYYTANTPVSVIVEQGVNSITAPSSGYYIDSWILVNKSTTLPIGSTHYGNPTTLNITADYTLTLYLLKVPSISPSSVTMDVGQSQTFTSSVDKNTTSPSYQWYLNGAPFSGATNPSWTFEPSSTQTGSNNVYLKITDVHGVFATSNTATVTVNPAPSVTISPSSVTILLGCSQTFTATVSGGTSPFSYQWCLNGAKVSGATSASWTFTPSAVGPYTVYVNVTDSAGIHAKSNTASVTVKPYTTGCVLANTRILMADGKEVPVQDVKPGDEIMGYDVQTGKFVVENVTSNNCTVVNEVLSINGGLLCVTPTDQPIYTDHGWVVNPQDLEVGWRIYDPADNSWTTIKSLQTLNGHFDVYDLRATNPNTFIGNGILLDRKSF
jgi:hypothetical protein